LKENSIRIKNASSASRLIGYKTSFSYDEASEFKQLHFSTSSDVRRWTLLRRDHRQDIIWWHLTTHIQKITLHRKKT